MAQAKKPAKSASGDKRERGGKALYAVVGEDVLASLDRWVDTLNERATGPKWTRQDVVKAICVRALRERGEAGKEP